jgi:hypothetical protein
VLLPGLPRLTGVGPQGGGKEHNNVHYLAGGEAGIHVSERHVNPDIFKNVRQLAKQRIDAFETCR